MSSMVYYDSLFHVEIFICLGLYYLPTLSYPHSQNAVVLRKKYLSSIFSASIGNLIFFVLYKHQYRVGGLFWIWWRYDIWEEFFPGLFFLCCVADRMDWWGKSKCVVRFNCSFVAVDNVRVLVLLLHFCLCCVSVCLNVLPTLPSLSVTRYLSLLAVRTCRLLISRLFLTQESKKMDRGALLQHVLEIRSTLSITGPSERHAEWTSLWKPRFW